MRLVPRAAFAFCSVVWLIPVCPAGAQTSAPSAPSAEPAEQHEQMQMNMAANALAIHAGRPVPRRVQPSGRPARRRRVRRAELVDGDGEPHGRHVAVDVHQHVEPRSGDGRQDGYREIFQVGEAAERPAADRSSASARLVHAAGGGLAHAVVGRRPGSRSPADRSASRRSVRWRSCIARRRPTIRSRRSSHHTFDSTHISFGVVTAAVDHGRWLVEGSVFNGREPDEHRWDFDFGRLDSVFRPALVSADCRMGASGVDRPPDAIPNSWSRETSNARPRRRRGCERTAPTSRP